MQSWNHIWLFEGNQEAEGAPGEDEFDTPGLEHRPDAPRLWIWSPVRVPIEATNRCINKWNEIHYFSFLLSLPLSLSVALSPSSLSKTKR